MRGSVKWKMANKYVIGILVLVLLTASVYILIPENVRIDVGKTYSTFKVWENDTWVLAGQEYSLMFDGTTKMRASSRTVEHFVDEEVVTIIRTANFKNNVTVIDTYTFDGNEKDIRLFPISHEINVLNGEGYILVYEVTKLDYSGETVKDILSPQEFGHKMKIEWEDGNYYSRIWGYSNKDEGKLTVKYRPDSSYFTKQVKLFDPPENYIIKDNMVYIDNSDAFISATPHTLVGAGWVEFNFTSKIYTGDIDIVLGFDTEALKPKRVQKYDPSFEFVEHTYRCDYDYNYTMAPNYLWCFRDVEVFDEGNTSHWVEEIVWGGSFISYNLSAKEVYWEEEELVIWKDVIKTFNNIDYDYQSMNKWWYVQDFSVVEDEQNVFRVEMKSTSLNVDEKYWFAIKPSGQTIQQAIAGGTFYALDPWVIGLNTDILSYWKLDDASGNAIDSLGINDGTVNDATYGASGIISDGYGTAAGEFNVDLNYEPLTLPFTLSIWLNTTATNTRQMIFTNYNLGARDMFFELEGAGGSAFYAAIDGLGGGSFSSMTPAEGFVHMVLTANVSGGLWAYKNSVKVLSSKTGSNTDVGSGVDFSLGTRLSNPGFNPWQGTMDEVGIWNRVLLQAEIDNLYSGGVGITWTDVFDTCTCPGAGNNWEVDMEDMCTLSTSCTLTTGNLTFIGSSGWFNCSSNLNISNRDAIPSGTTFDRDVDCLFIRLIALILLPATIFKRKRSLKLTWK